MVLFATLRVRGFVLAADERVVARVLSTCTAEDIQKIGPSLGRYEAGDLEHVVRFLHHGGYNFHSWSLGLSDAISTRNLEWFKQSAREVCGGAENGVSKQDWFQSVRDSIDEWRRPKVAEYNEVLRRARDLQGQREEQGAQDGDAGAIDAAKLSDEDRTVFLDFSDVENFAASAKAYFSLKRGRDAKTAIAASSSQAIPLPEAETWTPLVAISTTTGRRLSVHRALQSDGRHILALEVDFIKYHQRILRQKLTAEGLNSYGTKHP